MPPLANEPHILPIIYSPSIKIYFTIMFQRAKFSGLLKSRDGKPLILQGFEQILQKVTKFGTVKKLCELFLANKFESYSQSLIGEI